MVTTTVTQIDLSHEDSLQVVLHFLHARLPETRQVWSLLRYIQQGLVDQKYFWPHQLFVDDRDHIKCVIFVYSTVGFTTDHSHLDDDMAVSSRNITFVADEENHEVLLNLLEQCVPWFNIKTIFFCDIAHRFLTTIENIVREKNLLGNLKIFSCLQMEIDQKKLEETKKQLVQELRSDIAIQRLSITDAALIDEFSLYKSKFSLAQIKYQIEHLPTFGAYCQGQLVSWCLTQFDGSFGMAFTIPEFRRLGLATLLNIQLASELFKMQERVFCFVIRENEASCKMLKKLGYHQTCAVDWIHLTSK
ncbi:unnamed protein product [Rotaria sp. Silwood1]|nr:unnamed protein product [Rotaria sp. Silwood1]CAF1190208.1 unnamed protein product [Rotaria sp. Silwood1]CAF3436819.1 unnamed protein product [Rotaria sp. Silwood1]CAF4767509.1 unnamed protein product [Rotaria sp. Silwood1]